MTSVMAAEPPPMRPRSGLRDALTVSLVCGLFLWSCCRLSDPRPAALAHVCGDDLAHTERYNYVGTRGLVSNAC